MKERREEGWRPVDAAGMGWALRLHAIRQRHALSSPFTQCLAIPPQHSPHPCYPNPRPSMHRHMSQTRAQAVAGQARRTHPHSSCSMPSTASRACSMLLCAPVSPYSCCGCAAVAAVGGAAACERNQPVPPARCTVSGDGRQSVDRGSPATPGSVPAKALTCPPNCPSYTSPPGSAGLLRQPLMGSRTRW